MLCDLCAYINLIEIQYVIHVAKALKLVHVKFYRELYDNVIFVGMW